MRKTFKSGKIVFISLTAFLTLLPSKIIHAQKAKIELDHITTENGLSQGSINAILQDRRGFMWFGADNGLNKFDGYRFTIYKHDPFDSTLISDNLVTVIYEDKAGRLNRFDPETEKFYRYTVGPENSNSLCNPDDLSIFEVQDADNYFFKIKGSNNNGVWNEKGAAVKIARTPLIWQTWWAYTLYVLMFGFVLWRIRRFELNKKKREARERLRQEQQQAKLHEAELRAKTAELKAKAAKERARAIEAEKVIENTNIRYRIAADLHDEIGSNLSSIALLSELIQKRTNLGDKDRQQFLDINRIARFSANALRDIVWFINPANDRIENLLLRMRDVATTMLINIKTNFDISEIKLLEKVDLEFRWSTIRLVVKG